MIRAALRQLWGWLRRLHLTGNDRDASPSPDEVSSRVHRVYETGKPRYQLRPGEEGVSVFDALKVMAKAILPYFREGSLVTTQDVARIEAIGLRIVKTPGDPRLPELLRANHAIIGPSEGMTRKQFKQALNSLEEATGNPP